MNRWNVCACAVFVLLFASHDVARAQSADAMKYQLQENEYLIVAGKEYRELTCEYSEDGQNVMINGSVVASRYGDPARSFSETLTLEDAWKQSPFAVDKMSGGLDADFTLLLFKEKVDEFAACVHQTRELPTRDQWLQAVKLWMENPLNSGVVEFAEMRPLGLTFKIYGDQYPLTIQHKGGVFEDRVEQTVERHWREVVGFFESDGAQMLLVGDHGSAGYFAGPVVPALRSQVLAIVATGKYVAGPLKQPLAIGYGLVGGGK